MIRFLKEQKKTKDAEELLSKANPEDAEFLRGVYIKYEKGHGEHEWKFCGVMNENDEVDDSEDEMVIVPFTSVYGGYKEFEEGDIIVNVIGSSQDPNTDGSSWISLMKIVYRVLGLGLDNLEVCCSCPKYVQMKTDGTYFIDQHTCSGGIVGAHITDKLWGVFEEANAGNKSIYLLPLCKSMNGKNYTLMCLNKNIVGIHLNNYKQY